MAEKSIALPDRPRILVSRTDRIGDVVLSLPVFTSIREAYPNAYICVLAREYTRDLLTDRNDIDEVLTFDSDTSHIPWSASGEMIKQIKERRFDVFIGLFSNFSVAAMAFRAGIPVRIGPASKIAQMFFTHRIVQRRSKGTRHEADHNLDLLRPLNIKPIRKAEIFVGDNSAPHLKKSADRPLIGVHPGSGGSSRNWPEQNYIELVKKLSDADTDVVVTGSSAERELVERIVAESGSDAQIYIGENGLKELVAVLSQLDVFIAPSTGPLHLASAVGTPVVGLYCPIFVCLPQRWGPIGPNDTALVPDVPSCEKCIESGCEHWDCMEKIDVELVSESAIGKVGASISR